MPRAKSWVYSLESKAGALRSGQFAVLSGFDEPTYALQGIVRMALRILLAPGAGAEASKTAGNRG